jgi:hypothetical protein
VVSPLTTKDNSKENFKTSSNRSTALPKEKLPKSLLLPPKPIKGSLSNREWSNGLSPRSDDILSPRMNETMKMKFVPPLERFVDYLKISSKFAKNCEKWIPALEKRISFLSDVLASDDGLVENEFNYSLLTTIISLKNNPQSPYQGMNSFSPPDSSRMTPSNSKKALLVSSTTPSSTTSSSNLMSGSYSGEGFKFSSLRK